MKKEKYYLIGQQRKSKTLYYVFLGIIVFIVIYFPFFAVNLRFQTGYMLSKILDYIGGICLTLGGLLTAFSVASLFLGSRSMRTKWFILGIVLLWAGCWCTGSVIEFFGISIGDASGTPGYH
jgi:hypothetical protein